MKAIISTTILAIGLAAGSSSLAQDASTGQFVAGQDYEELDPRQPTSTGDGTVEVAEVFMYSCPHCNTFEGPLGQWKKDKADYITFIRIPAAWNPSVEVHARAYYVAEALGILEETHAPFFREFHEQRNYLESKEKIGQFFAKFGVDEATFSSTYDSFLVDSKLKTAKDLVRRYNIQETPSVVINGRYVSKGRMAGNYQRWFQIIDELAAREHEAAN